MKKVLILKNKSVYYSPSSDGLSAVVGSVSVLVVRLYIIYTYNE